MTNLSTFRPIPGYEDLYLISPEGEIFSKYRKKTLIPHIHEKGYLDISLNKDGKANHFRIHRLVAMTFIPNPDNLPCINHKNGIKTDNRVENLEWCSYSDNMKHAWDSGLCEKTRASIKKSIKYATESRVRHLDDNLKELFDDIFKNCLKVKEICKKYNIKNQYVSNIKNKKTLKTAISEYFSNNPDIVYQPKSNKVKKISFKEKIQTVISKYIGDLNHE